LCLSGVFALPNKFGWYNVNQLKINVIGYQNNEAGKITIYTSVKNIRDSKNEGFAMLSLSKNILDFYS
jgi:hypothetical protein